MGSPDVRTGIVVQARMSSTRLPGKVLAPLAGRPMLWHIIERLATLKQRASVVVATGDSTRDDPVAAFCAEVNVPCFRGSEPDVLARYYECARVWMFDQIVRVTGDNPFVDADELGRLIEFHAAGGFDFSCSFDELPVGVGAETFTFAALERSWREGHRPHHREHVDEYVLENPDRFATGRLAAPASKRRPDVRLTVDTLEDLRRARFVVEHAAGPLPGTEEAIALCSRFA